MLTFVDLSYFKHSHGYNLSQVIDSIRLSFTYLGFLRQHFKIQVIQHGVSPAGQLQEDGITYTGFPGSDGFFHIPYNAHRYLRRLRPGIVLVQGLIFPVQVTLLRQALGRRVIILAQHHGEQPFINPVKRFFQKQVDKYIDGYLFTSLGNAKPWIDEGIIASSSKCFEVLECSTQLSPLDKDACRQKLGIAGTHIFLWVGRLNAGKDPLTVLEGFERFLAQQRDAKLYMIYQTEELLDDVRSALANSEKLKQAVTLVGKLLHHELPAWYSAADYYISGSHREGSGYALIEAMACGCIPVVTNIPPFTAITGGGQHAVQFDAGNVDSLVHALQRLPAIDRKAFSGRVAAHFNRELSFQNISDRIKEIATALAATKQ